MHLSLLTVGWFQAIASAQYLHGIDAKVPEERRIAQRACSGPSESSPTTWWRAAIDHNGTAPTAEDTTYQYYRTAVQYGADNTGIEDSSAAFVSAINGQWSLV